MPLPYPHLMPLGDGDENLTPPQKVISLLLNSACGQVASKEQFDLKLRDAAYGSVDRLLVICVKWFFKNCDFTEFIPDVIRKVKGKPLASFVDTRMSMCPQLVRVICEHAENKSRCVKLLIKKDEWAVSVGRGRLITFPFTEDMDEPATILAEYTQLFFSVPSNNVEFAFEGSYGLSRNMDITPTHIMLLSKLRPEHFAERGVPQVKQERIPRLVVRMSRISWDKSGIYYNAILELFKKYRGVVLTQGEQPVSKVHMTYQEVLEHVQTNPGVVLLDEQAKVCQNISMKKRKRKIE